MKYASAIVSVLLGLLFLMASVTFFLGMVPEQQLPPGSAQESFTKAFGPTGYMMFVKVCEFIGAVLVRVIWMFTGNKYSHWDKFISINRTRLKGFMPTVFFYMFLRDKPPGYVGHNPVAASAYSLVFGLYFLAIGTGLVMRGASADVDSPIRWFATTRFPGYPRGTSGTSLLTSSCARL